MRKFYRICLLAIALIVLFGLLALPALAVESNRSGQLLHTGRSGALLLPPVQITFTLANTLYLPVIVNPNNNLKIISLDYASQDETVVIKNLGPAPQSFDGWQLVSVRGSQIYDFPSGILLAAGQSLRVHSGPGAFGNPPGDLFWTTAFIWNNQGDKAELRDNQGSLRDSVCYLTDCP